MDPQRPPTGSPPISDAQRLRAAWRALDAARTRAHEDPDGVLATAEGCGDEARTLGSVALRARSLALRGALTLYRGDLRGAFTLAVQAAEAGEASGDDTARIEVAALEAQLCFFSGFYRDALRHAERMIALADRNGATGLRVFARRSACMVLGSLAAPEWPGELDELLRLAVQRGDRWDEAISRNDLAHYRMTCGEQAEAEAEIERALAIADSLPAPSSFVRGVVRCTRAEIRLAAGRVDPALADAERAIELLCERGEPNPYLFGMAVRVEVQALLAAGRPDDAWRRGQRAVDRVGEGVPQARGMILQDVARALRQAGRADEAYLALEQSAELERVAFRELSELQRDLERAVLETDAARREAETLTAKNRELETIVRQLGEAHAELEVRAQQLETLQAQLREQADRDYLTGLHNRRYLARTLEDAGARRRPGPCSLAVLDLDHFKVINDRFGHDVGDRVLVRVARLLLDVVRATDVVARMGGEEFVVLMPSTDPGAATACAERIRCAIGEEPWQRICPELVVTASVGVASAPGSEALESLVPIADRRLYAAKHAGRNRVDAVFLDPPGDTRRAA